MLYGYDTYSNYPPVGLAQPHTDLYFVSPDSPAARHGLNQEEIRELLKEQERCDREFQQEVEGEERARRSAQHQEQEQHQDEARWVPTPSISDSEPTPQAYEMPDEAPETATSLYDGGSIDRGDSPAAWYQPPTSIPDNTYPTPQPEYIGYDEHVTPVDANEPDANDANAAPEHDSVIERLARELIVSGNASGNWAEEMEMEIGLVPQGEYIQANYSPPPAAPSPAPWHPHPPTSHSVHS